MQTIFTEFFWDPKNILFSSDKQYYTELTHPFLWNHIEEHSRKGKKKFFLDRISFPTLMAESKEELKVLLMKVKEESERTGLKLNIQTKIMASGPISSWQIDGETMETMTDFK